MKNFSLNSVLLGDILHHAKPMGHNEAPDNLNLGFGFLYYGIARALRPKHCLVIGSGFGFSVVCFALGIKDNGEGTLTFVDPAYSLIKDGPFKTIGGSGKWSEPQKVADHFRQFGVEDVVTHYRLTADRLFESYSALGLPEIDIAFIDGNHSFENVKNDFLHVLEHARKNSYVFLHDTNIYIREMIRHSGVKRWMGIIKKEEEFFETINFPFSSGVALVRVLQDDAWRYAKTK